MVITNYIVAFLDMYKHNIISRLGGDMVIGTKAFIISDYADYIVTEFSVSI